MCERSSPMRVLVSPTRVFVSPRWALLIKILTSTRSMVGTVLNAIVRICVSFISLHDSCSPLFFLIPGAPLPALDGERTDQQHPGHESAHVGEPGGAATGVIGGGQRPQAAAELDDEPPDEHGPRRNLDGGDKDNNGHQRHD